jgi:hypothetical protein
VEWLERGVGRSSRRSVGEKVAETPDLASYMSRKKIGRKQDVRAKGNESMGIWCCGNANSIVDTSSSTCCLLATVAFAS